MEDSKAIDTVFIGSLLAEVFGVVASPFGSGLPYLPYTAFPFPNVKTEENNENKGNEPVYSGVELEEAAPEYDNAPVRFGQKTWGAFWLEGGTYNKWNIKGKLKQEEFSDFLMPLATLVDFRRDKVVKKTPTLGGSGTVKEIYGLDDWNISINGIILTDKYNPLTQQTVEEQMEIMQQFHEIAGAIDVKGQVFAQREITRIVTESLNFTPVQGKPGMMQFSMIATSDDDLILTDLL